MMNDFSLLFGVFSVGIACGICLGLFAYAINSVIDIFKKLS